MNGEISCANCGRYLGPGHQNKPEYCVDCQSAPSYYRKLEFEKRYPTKGAPA